MAGAVAFQIIYELLPGLGVLVAFFGGAARRRRIFACAVDEVHQPLSLLHPANTLLAISHPRIGVKSRKPKLDRE